MTHVSAIIPNYNGLSLLQKNLPAVLDCLRSGDEVLVVDDCSSDDSVEWLANNFSLSVVDNHTWRNPRLMYHPRSNSKHQLKDQTKHQSGHQSKSQSNKPQSESKELVFTLLRNSHNSRFAASCNIGVAAASHGLVLLLNNDVSPSSDVIRHLLPHFDEDSVFGVGCLELEGENVQGGKNRLWFERGMFQHSRADSYTSGQTAWVSGGSGLFDRDKFLGLGGFDENYSPAYWEDVDLSYRARLQGWRVLFSQEALVHHEHESTNKSALGAATMQMISWRNGCYFTWKNGDVWQKIAYVLWKPYWWWKRRGASETITKIGESNV